MRGSKGGREEGRRGYLILYRVRRSASVRRRASPTFGGVFCLAKAATVRGLDRDGAERRDDLCVCV